MSPRVIYMPMSGGDRKNLKKSLDAAKGTHEAKKQREATVRREGEKMLRAAEATLREADKLKCEAWSAIMFCGGPATDSPTMGQTINGGYPFLRVCCNRCSTERRLDLRTMRRPLDMQVHLIEAALFCDACSTSRWKQRAHILWLESEAPSNDEAS